MGGARDIGKRSAAVVVLQPRSIALGVFLVAQILAHDVGHRGPVAGDKDVGAAVMASGRSRKAARHPGTELEPTPTPPCQPSPRRLLRPVRCFCFLSAHAPAFWHRSLILLTEPPPAR